MTSTLTASAPATQLADVASFLETIWPADGVVIAIAWKDGKPRQRVFTDTASLMTWLTKQDASGFDCYFALASFRDAKGVRNERTGKIEYRCRKNVLYVASLWLEVDSRESKNEAPYASREEARQAVLQFCEDAGLPAPIINMSGGGPHVFWPLAVALTLEEWQPLADGLKAACVTRGLSADPTRTADATSVLRLPLTHHWKSGRVVELGTLADRYPVSAFEHLKAFATTVPARNGAANPDTNAGILGDLKGIDTPFHATPTNIATFVAALNFVDPGYYFGRPEDYPGADPKRVLGWFHGMCAIKSLPWPSEWKDEIATAWSRLTTRNNYPGDDDVLRKLAEDIDDRGITYKSVFAWARDRGWNGRPHADLLESLTTALDSRSESSQLVPPELSKIFCSGGSLPEDASAGEAALVAARATIYARGGHLVMPVVEEVDAARPGCKTMVAQLKEISAACLTDHLGRVAIFMRLDKRSGSWVKVNPPDHVAKTILSRHGEWTFPALAGVITTSVMRHDGSILSTAGYDPRSRLYLMNPLALPPIPEKPSRAAAEAALTLLTSLLSGFPFVDEASRSVALSGLMTPVLRPAMATAPLHVGTAPAAGTGKSYWVDICHAIATGQLAPAMAAGQNPEETEKRVASAVIAGRSIISIDNLNGELEGDLLCQLVERPLVQVRILGRSQLIETETKATVFANGNNIVPRGDMVRRTLLCSMDANLERPEQRKFATDPVAAVLTDRGKYVAAILTIVRSFIVAERPCQPPPLASYADWSAMVRAPLIWLGCEDPVATQEVVRANDPETAQFRAVMDALHPLIGAGGRALLTSEIKQLAEENVRQDSADSASGWQPKWPALKRSLLEVAGNLRNTHDVDTVRLGRYLSRRAGKVIDGYKLNKQTDTHSGHLRWQILPP